MVKSGNATEPKQRLRRPPALLLEVERAAAQRGQRHRHARRHRVRRHADVPVALFPPSDVRGVDVVGERGAVALHGEPLPPNQPI